MNKEEVKLIHFVPHLNEQTVQIAESLFSSYRAEDCHNYRTLDQDTDDDVTPEIIKDFIQAMKKLGLVRTYKGLMTDDGEVAGSGFAIPSQEACNLIELAIYRHNYNDRPMWKQEDFVPKKIQVGEHEYKLIS